jgi:hypothetical protein
MFPLIDKLAKRFPEFRYTVDVNSLVFFYKRDPYVYGPDVLCVFDTTSNVFLFENKTYTVEQFNRVLDLLTFI